MALSPSTGDAIVTVDRQHCIVTFDAAAERMFRCSGHGAVGQPIVRFIPAGLSGISDASPIVSGVRAGGERFRIEATISSTETGDRKYLSVLLRDLDPQERASGVQPSEQATAPTGGRDEVAARPPDPVDRWREDERQADAAVLNERLLSDTMIESLPGIVYFYDESGRFVRWNHNFSVVSGYSDEEITRMHPLDFFRGDEKALVERRIGEVFDKGESFVEASFVDKNGLATPYFLTGRRVIVHGAAFLVGMGIDITARRQVDDRLAESERQYRELVELANSIILRWRSDGRIVFLNEFGQRFFGYSAEEVVGRHVMGTIVPLTETGGRDLERLMEQIRADPAAFEQNVNENIRRSGERVSIAWTNRIVGGACGEGVEILSVGTDISERKRAEMALRVLNDTLELKVAARTGELRAALVRAESADRIKSSFLATMSHELRTPLNSILGFTGILLQEMAGPLTPEQTTQLDMVRSSGRHLLDLINDVLDLSKIEAGQLEVRAERFDLSASIERVIASLRPLAEKKLLRLDTVLSPALVDMVSDRRRVEQILLNLVNNAIKFTDLGVVTLTVESVGGDRPLADAAARRAVRFRVADTGSGIAPADLDTLFQPFRQIDSGLTRRHEGTGLGLAICRRLAGLLGGEISATSERSKGSEFMLTLPFLPLEDP